LTKSRSMIGRHEPIDAGAPPRGSDFLECVSHHRERSLLTHGRLCRKSCKNVLVYLEKIFPAAELQGEGPRHVAPGNRTDLIIKRGQAGIYTILIDQGPILQMSIRIATGDHEGKTPDEFEIGFFTDDLPNQQRTLLVGDLIVFETRWKTDHL